MGGGWTPVSVGLAGAAGSLGRLLLVGRRWQEQPVP